MVESFDGGCSASLESWRREHGRPVKAAVNIPAVDGCSSTSAAEVARLRVEQGLGETGEPYVTHGELAAAVTVALAGAGRAGRGAAWAAMDLEDRVAALETQVADLAGQVDELIGRVEALEGAGGD